MSQLEKDAAIIEARFLEALRRHLAGLRSKVAADFGKESFERELADLQRDALYRTFCFDSPEYVLVRFMGRISISIGRRLGEIYDKIPRFVAGARFRLAPEVVAPTINGLELDIGLRFNDLSTEDSEFVKTVAAKYVAGVGKGSGLGIEIRYNFNPNDSARLRKDVVMAEYVRQEHLTPVYLIFSGISPRDEAIARLKRAGWEFLIAEQAARFAQELFGLDLAKVLDQPKIREEIRQEVDSIMKAMVASYAFQQVLGRHKA